MNYLSKRFLKALASSSSVLVSTLWVFFSLFSPSPVLVYAGDVTPPVVTITNPSSDSSLLNRLSISVEGTVNDPSATVLVNGVLADIENGIFYANILLDEGRTSIDVSATDKAGNTSSASRWVTVDSTAPVVVISSPENGLAKHSSFTVTGIIYDDSAKVMVNGVPAKVSNSLFTATVRMPEGAGEIVVTAMDEAGNVGRDSLSVEVDTTAPEILISEPVNRFQTNQSTLVLKGIVAADASLVTVNGVPVEVEGETFQATVLLDGNMDSITATAVDKAGNTRSDSIGVTLDTVPPRIVVTEPKNYDSVNRREITVRGTVDDKSAKIFVNGVAAAVRNGLFTAKRVKLELERNIVSVVAEDRAGNRSVLTLEIFVDMSAPAVDIKQPVSGFVTNRKAVSVSGSVSDNSAQVSVNGVPAIVVSGTYTAASVPLNSGKNRIHVTAEDLAGNMSETEIHVLQDKVPPKVTVSEPKSGFVSNRNSLTVRGTVDDAFANVMVNGVEAVVSSGTYTASGVFLIEGENEILAIATDRAGNKSQKAIRVFCDTQAPVLSITSPVSESLIAQRLLTVKGTVDDRTAHVTVNGVKAVVKNGVFKAKGVLPEKDTNAVRAEAVDPAGNIGISSIVIRDSIPPEVTITAPEKDLHTNKLTVTVTGTVNDGTATVLVNGQSVWVGDGLFVAKGVLLQEGTNSISVSASDRFGNKSLDRITVVRKTVAPEVEIVSPEKNYRTNKGHITVSGRVDDPEAFITINDHEVVVKNGAFTLENLLLRSGVNSIEVIVRDPYGNVWSDQFEVVKDSEAPMVVIEVPASGYVTNKSIITVQGSVNDDLATISINGIRAVVQNGTFQCDNIPLKQGENVLRLEVVDVAGNRGDYSSTVIYDTIAPEIRITSPVDGMQTGEELVTVEGTTDGKVIEVLVNGVRTVVRNGRFEVSGIFLGHGVNTLRAKATDGAGNTGFDIVKVTYDNVPPVLSITEPTDGFSTNHSHITVKGRVDERTAVVVVNGITALVGQGTFIAVGVPLLQGSNVIKAIAKDEVGNRRTETLHVVFDTEPPLIQIVRPIQGSMTNKMAIVVTGTIDDNNGKVVVNDVAAEVRNGEFTATNVLLDEGLNSIQITAIDTLGNIGSFATDVFLDTSPPVVTITSPYDGLVLNTERVSIRGTVTENSALVTVNGQKAAIQNGVFEFSGVALKQGVNLIEVIGMDEAGNSSSDTVELVLDTTAPSLVIETPGNGITVAHSVILVSGTVGADFSKVTVNGIQAVVKKGKFEVAEVPLQEGDNTITVAVTDSIGNSTLEKIMVTLDKTPPVFSLLSPKHLLRTNKAEISVQGTIDDNTAKVFIDDKQALVQDGKFSIPGLLLAEGMNSISVEASDLVGNISKKSLTVLLDSIPPALAVIRPVPGFVTKKGAVSVSGTVDESVVSVTVNGMDAKVSAGDFFLHGVPLVQGNNVVEVCAVDFFGNQSVTKTEVFLDTEAPVLILISPADGLSTNRAGIVVKGRVNDPDARVFLNGKAVKVSKGFFQSESVHLKNGQNVFRVRSMDNAGNDVTQTVTIFRDSIPPSLEIVEPVEGLRTNTPLVSVQGRVNDPSSRVTVNGIYAELSQGRFTFSAISLMPGENTIEIHATDPAGNVNAKRVYVVLDNILPQVTITSPVKQRFSTNKESITVAGLVDDPLAEVFVNGAKVETKQGFFKQAGVLLFDGENSIEVLAVDSTGNIGSKAVRVNYDKVPPLVKITSPSLFATLNTSTITVTGRVNENDATVTVNGISAKMKGNSFTAWDVSLKNGRNTVIVVAKDPAGNSGEATMSLFLDLLGPKLSFLSHQAGEITGDDSITIIGDVDDPYAVVAVNGKKAEVGDGKFVATGVRLIYGKNIITAKAKDRAGNETTQKIGVVLDNKPPLITLFSPAPDSMSNRNTILVEGRVDDLDATVQVNGIFAAVQNGSFLLPAVQLENGFNSLEVVATDKVGNRQVKTVQLFVDTTAPVVIITRPNDQSSFNTPTVTVQGAVGDASTDVTVNGKKAIVRNGTFTVSNIPLKHGRNKIRAKIKDSAGNFGSDVITVVYDTEPPVISVTSHKKSAFINQNHIRIAGVIDDSLASVEINGLPAEVQNGKFESSPLVFKEGSNSVMVTATDKAGNSSKVISTFTLDTVPPTVSITTPLQDFSTRKPFISVTGAVDATARIVTVNGIRARIKKGMFVAPKVVLAEGRNSIRVEAVDAFGNVGESEVLVHFGPDLIPPEIVILSPKARASVETATFLVHGRVNEPASLILVNGNVATLDGLSFKADVFQPSCTKEISVEATDFNGNTSSSTVTVWGSLRIPSSVEENSSLTGYVFDFESGKPLSGVLVSVEGVCGSAQTDSSGKYVFSVTGFPQYSSVRNFAIRVRKVGYTSVTTVALGAVSKSLNVSPLYLTPNDSALTSVYPEIQKTAVNSSGDAELMVPSGGVRSPVHVSITLVDSEERLPVELPPGTSIYSMGKTGPPGFFFKAPALVRLPNRHQMPPGSILPWISLDSESQTWVRDGVAQVSEDGLFVEKEVQKLSWAGAVFPTIPVYREVEKVWGRVAFNNIFSYESALETLKGFPCGLMPGCVKRGVLNLGFVLREEGLDGLKLVYVSNAAFPRKIVTMAGKVPEKAKGLIAEFTMFGQVQRIDLQREGEEYRMILDARNSKGEWLQSGIYPYSMNLSHTFDVVQSTTLNSGRFVTASLEKTEISEYTGLQVVDNRVESPFGSGWHLEELDRLIKDPVGGVAIIDGNGESTLFHSKNFKIDTIAGGGVPKGLAVHTSLSGPSAVAVDNLGNLFVSDYYNDRVFKVNKKGEILHFAGTGYGFGGDGGLATKASFRHPAGLAVDGKGNVYIADQGNNRVRKVDVNGLITTVAGSGAREYFGDGENALDVGLNSPGGIALDSAGNLYIADTNNHVVRKVDGKGKITTVAGIGQPGYSGDGRRAVLASLDTPFAVAVDGKGNLYISDSNNQRIRKVSRFGGITTVAGNGKAGYGGDRGPATLASLQNPSGIHVDNEGNIFISDLGNHRVRKVDSHGVITTLAGSDQSGFFGDEGSAVSARLQEPADVVMDEKGSLFIADIANARVRKVDVEGTITTVAGNGSAYFGNGVQGELASLSKPETIAADRFGNVYIVDTQNNRIRKLSADGVITTVAGNGKKGYSGDWGKATGATLNEPSGVALGYEGDFFISDSGNHRIRRVDSNGIISTIAGTGSRGYKGDGQEAVYAELNYPLGILLDTVGNLIIADSLNSRIRAVDRRGIITTIAGNGIEGFTGDMVSAQQSGLAKPSALATDSAGNLYIADTMNNRIRKRLNTFKVLTTVAGKGRKEFSGDFGDAVSANLANPGGVAIDESGNIFIADSENNRIRKVSSSGKITTIAGNGESGFSGDGGDAKKASLSAPTGVSLDNNGNIFIADTDNNRIRVLSYQIPLSHGVEQMVSLTGDDILELDPDGRAVLKYSGGGMKRFDKDGRHLETVAKDGKRTKYDYGADGRLVKIVRPTGDSVVFVYGGSGLLQKIVGSSGENNYLVHDESGNLVSIEGSDGAVTLFSYDNRHLLSSWNSPTGESAQYKYNVYGDITSIVSPKLEDTLFKRSSHTLPPETGIPLTDTFQSGSNTGR